MLIDEILANWAGMPNANAMLIPSLSDSGYISWTIKTTAGYGVAIPVDSDEEVSEYFAGAHYYTGDIILDNSNQEHVLMLVTFKEEIKDQFAALCAELLAPGESGELRKEVSKSPVTWWMAWKELLGNKNVDLRVYDALGELWTMKYLAEHGEHAEWNGPDGATYDIDCESYYIEVKSTTARNKRQIMLSNLFQLDPPEGKKLFVVLCQFESSLSGISINTMVDQLEALGYSRAVLNDKLERLGLEKGMSARKRCYALHAATKYAVDEAFPAIRETSFVNGVLPSGVMSITYTVTLDGISGENILTDGE